MALDSDVRGGDSQLLVKFYEKEFGPHKGKDFIEILIPGNQNLVIDTLATEHHKKRFPHHWLRYQMDHSGAPVMSGIRLEDWMAEKPDDLNPDQLAELHHFKFQTVEQLSMAAAQSIQRIGMGGEGLQAKAAMFLKSKNKAASDTELAATKNELAELQKQVALLMSAKAETPAATQPQKKRRGCPPGGWPKKDKVIADGQHTPATSPAGHE
jgi:hypothetical protein